MKLLCEQAERQEDRQTDKQPKATLTLKRLQNRVSIPDVVTSEVRVTACELFFQCSKDIQYLKLGTLNLLPVV